MANINAPCGLAPKRYLDGRNIGHGQRMVHVSGDSTPIFVGDAVKLAGDADAFGYPTVTQCAASDQIYGVCVGREPITFDSKTYAEASKQCYITVIVATADMVFEIQEDSVGGSLALTQVGQNADLIVGSGNVNTGYSAMQLDSSTATTGTSLQLRIIGIDLTNPDNVIGTNARWEVCINKPQLSPGNFGV